MYILTLKDFFKGAFPYSLIGIKKLMVTDELKSQLNRIFSSETDTFLTQNIDLELAFDMGIIDFWFL